MTFTVFLAIMVFLTMFLLVSHQMRVMALAGKPIVGHLPGFLVRKLSDEAYIAISIGIGWVPVIVAGLVFNWEKAGPVWSAIFLGAMSVVYVLLWLKNRSLGRKS